MATSSLSSLSSLSSGDLLTTSEESPEDANEMGELDDEWLWPEVLGSDWWGNGILGSNATFLGSNLGSLDNLGSLSLDHLDDFGSDSSGHSSSHYSGDDDLELDSDVLEVSVGDDSDLDNVAVAFSVGITYWGQLRTCRWVQQQIYRMYESCYEVACDQLPWGPSRMHHILFTLKNTCPDQFQEEL
jgi:hypothetical protein